MNSVAVTATHPRPPIQVCVYCGFAFCEHPVRLGRALSRTAVGYERVAWAVLASQPSDEQGCVLLSQVVQVRDALHRYANRLERLAHFDLPVFADLDPEPIQAVALDYTWGAVTGLVANIHRLTAAVQDFPVERWHHCGVLQDRTVTALDLANDAVHESVHRLVRLEQGAPLTPGQSAGPVWPGSQPDDLTRLTPHSSLDSIGSPALGES